MSFFFIRDNGRFRCKLLHNNNIYYGWGKTRISSSNEALKKVLPEEKNEIEPYFRSLEEENRVYRKKMKNKAKRGKKIKCLCCKDNKVNYYLLKKIENNIEIKQNDFVL
jgi:hypothetical protein